MARRRGPAFAALEGCSVPAVAARNPETGAALAAELGARQVGGWEALVEGTWWTRSSAFAPYRT